MNSTLCKKFFTVFFLILSWDCLNAQQTVGLFFNHPASYQGYTLFSNNKITYLIDNCGYVVNQWESDYKPGSSVYLLENGNLLRTAKIDGDFSAGGSGGRFELYNWAGDLIWYYEIADATQHAHHDIAPLPNGNFLAIVWDKISGSLAQENGRAFEGDVWSEKIVELEMLGLDQATVVWEWKLSDHLIQNHDPTKANFGVVADHPEWIDFNYIGEGMPTSGDWIHLNAIDYQPGLDYIAISSRNFSEIWVIDHSTSSQEAAGHIGGNSGRGGDILYRYGNPHVYQRGTPSDQNFFEQHDVRWISEYKLMVFNNNYSQGQSSVENWTLPPVIEGTYVINTEEAFGPSYVDWIYTAPGFYSGIMSSAQLLPNENILICEGKEGRFFEITPTGEVVWEYINPVNSNGFPVLQGGTPHFNQTFSVKRYPADYPGFIGRDLSPGDPVELVPWDNDCDIHQTTATDHENHLIEFKLLQNPATDFLIYQNDIPGLRLTLYNTMGQVLRSFKAQLGINSEDISRLSPGPYFLVLEAFNKDSVHVFVKN